MKKLCLLILVAAAAALFSSALLADNYPSKPVTLVAVFGPGSASDTICRVIAQPLSVALKETVIVENRPGANGALAALYVARSAPDRSEEHTSELQSLRHLVCRLLLEKKNKIL